jgi:hypothetical protein
MTFIRESLEVWIIELTVVAKPLGVAWVPHYVRLFRSKIDAENYGELIQNELFCWRVRRYVPDEIAVATNETTVATDETEGPK